MADKLAGRVSLDADLPDRLHAYLDKTGSIAAPQLPERLLPTPDQESLPPPLAIVGVDPPDLLWKAYAEIEQRTDGYRPRVLVCEPSPEALLAGLGELAARRGPNAATQLLDASNIEWFVGPDARSELADYLREHPHDQLPKAVHATPGAPAAEGWRAYAEIVLQAARDQQRTLQHQMVRLRELQATHDPRANLRSGQPLRVLICTTRYSTYMKHSAADLARSLESQGHTVRVMLERDSHTRFTQLSYAHEVLALRPDAVVLINYMRPQLGPVLPPHVPLVTWVQDAMPHFFNGQPSLLARPNDFAAGSIYPDMLGRMGFHPRRTLRWHNPASAGKFHAAPVRGRDELRCEIAMATRHSEPPERFAERNIRTLDPKTPAGRAAERVAELLPATIARAAAPGARLLPELRTLTQSALARAFGGEPAPSAFSVLMHGFTQPLADLMFRQETARWAARIAERRGWRFHLYGDPGWAVHADLAEHARPELLHGEDLRAAYQLARVSLHASVCGLVHQRVAEIAFAGGLPVGRRTFEDVDRIRSHALNVLVGTQPFDACMAGTRERAYAIADHPELADAAEQWRRLGLELGEAGVLAVSAKQERDILDAPKGPPPPPDRAPGWIFVDLADSTFADEAGLERIVERASDEDHRRGLSARIAARCRERLGMDGFAEAVVGMLRQDAAASG
ncbi:MAG: hypothetical protein AAFX79_11025 [Planctomycetota bacterium]